MVGGVATIVGRGCSRDRPEITTGYWAASLGPVQCGRRHSQSDLRPSESKLAFFLAGQLVGHILVGRVDFLVDISINIGRQLQIG